MKVNSELEQSYIRLIILGLLFSWLIFNHDFNNHAVQLCLSYIAIATVIHLSIVKYPINILPRQILCLTMDISMTSYEFVLLGDLGGMLIGIYLWLVVGYGLRYGSTMLKLASVASIVGYLIATQFNPYYRVHTDLVYGLLLTLILVPLHTLRLLNQLSAAKRKAELANEAKSKFLSHISHEIRTPLNGVVGATDLMLGTQLNTEQKHLGYIIKNSAELLMQLINNVLDLSKIESGKMSVSNRDFNLNELLSKTISLFEPQTKQKNIQLSYEVAVDTPLALHSDFLHIRQVLVNMLTNAIKFTNKGYVKLNVKTLTQNETHATLRFEVIDTGVGIADDAIPHIFDSFTQADDSIKYTYGGTGLGTTISKELVALMGGTIGVESKLGSGSTFWFEITLEKARSQISTKIETPQESPLIEQVNFGSEKVISLNDHSKRDDKNKRQAHILVADDSDVNLTIVSKILTNAGHIVNTAKNGELALDLLECKQFDLMLLDSNMPVMNGLEVIKVHQVINIGNPRIPVMILSADATPDGIQKFSDVAIDAYLTKPIEIEHLLETVDKLLEQSFKNKNSHRYGDKSAEIVSYNNKTKLRPEIRAYVDVNRLESLKVLGADNHNFLQKLVDGFVSDTENNLTLLKKSIENREFLSIANVGHAISGAAGDIGAEELERLAQELDAVLPTDSMIAIEELAQKIDTTYTLSKAEIYSYLKSLDLPKIQ